MHLFIVLLGCLAIAYANVIPSGSNDYWTLGCPATTTPLATPQQQLTAVTNYYNDLFSGQVTQAFQTYTAKNFINHAPEVTGDGQAAAEQALAGLLSHSNGVVQNIFVGKNRSGTDLASIYFKITTPIGTEAVMESWRFAGDCLIEHWNVGEAVDGNATNPKAFF